MIKNCPICGKAFDVLYPDLWRYKRRNGNELFICSWGCIRKYDKGKEEEKTMAMMKKDGTPAKKPGPKAKKKIEIPEQVPVVKVDGALKIETPEDGKVDVVPVIPDAVPMVPKKVDGLTVREVEGNFGRYRYTDIGPVAYIDFESRDLMDTLSLTVEQWKKFRDEQVKAAKILGVEL